MRYKDITNDSTNTARELYSDEENRLMVLSDNCKTGRYTYNAAGECIIKSHGDLECVCQRCTTRNHPLAFSDFRLHLSKTNSLVLHSVCTEVPRDGELHDLSCSDYHRDEEPLHQALLYRR